MVLLSLLIKLEKHISVLKRDSPSSRIAKEILDSNDIDCSTRVPEKFMQIPKIINLNINCFGDSIGEYVKLENRYFIEKYKSIPKSSEFAISNNPFWEDVPNILSKYGVSKISESMKVISSRAEYKLLSIEENKFWNIVFMVSIIVLVILTFDVSSNLSHPIQLMILLQLILNQLLV